MYVQHVKFLDSIDITSISKGVKSSLRKHIESWKHVGANEVPCFPLNVAFFHPLNLTQDHHVHTHA
jgi:hypothetical protein